MSKQKRYSGAFLSRTNKIWRIEIWQEADEPYGEVGDLIFPAESPLTIEWPETETKLSPVVPSAATLQVISDTDRRFLDLYQVAPGMVRLDVYKDNDLYWSGTLDPEFYEEPYAYKDNYIVAFTFSDFAILNRFKFAKMQDGDMSLSSLIEQAVKKTAILVAADLETLISTTLPEGQGDHIFDCVFMEDNFKDEDSEPMMWMEMLQTVLQPFALRIQQKNGRIHIYDLNELYATQSREIYWTATDAVLGIDKTFNNATVIFSPYMQNTMIEVSIDPKAVTGGDEYIIRTNSSEDSFEGFRFRTKIDTHWKLIGNERLFRIDPLMSSQSMAGVGLLARVGIVANGSVAFLKLFNHVVEHFADAPIYTVEPREKPELLSSDAMKAGYMLQLNAKLMIDGRMNPFEEATQFNNKEVYDAFGYLWRWYMGFRLRLKDSQGNVIYHYKNDNIILAELGFTSVPEFYALPPTGSWVEGDYTDWNMAYMSFYTGSGNNGESHPAQSGDYIDNRHPLPFRTVGLDLPSHYTLFSEGENIPMPPTRGKIELIIYPRIVTTGIFLIDLPQPQIAYLDHAKWIFLNDITLNLLDKYGKEVENNDIEIVSHVEPDALEEITIETKAGTLQEEHPLALGQIFADNEILRSCTRAGFSASLEKLLCGTIYSQYKGRKMTLSGTSRLVADLTTITDAATQDTVFMIASEVQNPITDESAIKLLEIAPDNYEGIEIS
jgi:hypothetical protein